MTIEPHIPDTNEPAAPLHPPLRASRRIDGWTAERQAAFLEHVADGISADHAARMVGLTPTSAYAFRRRAAGAAFALGWRAACLVARDRIADDLMARAYQGQTVTIVRPDGSEVTRHYHDNRLAMSLLSRLDRLAEQADDADSRAARLVANEFDAFVDLIERDDAAPARAGLFLARRLPAQGDDGEARDLGPVLALAACDRFARTGCATAGEVDIADLDPAARAGWSAEQWARAEAAGLVAIAASAPVVEDDDEDEDARETQHSQRSRRSAAREGARDADADEVEDYEEEDDAPFDGHIWWDDHAAVWATDFPPPPGFDGYAEGAPDDDLYWRTLAPAEDALVQAKRAADRAARDADRDQWFAALAQEVRGGEGESQGGDPGTMLADAPPRGKRH